jgi:indolepyruvate ferredoxin oxidoreductase
VSNDDDQPAPIAVTLDEIVAKRQSYLTAYQNEKYAAKYTDAVARFKALDQSKEQEMTHAVARYYHKLLAYKDEYEVARLYTDGQFLKKLKKQFDGDYKLSFHLAPPMLKGSDPATGRPKKRQFGGWMINGFKLLKKFKFLRGTALDPFGYHPERKEERKLIAEYEHFMDVVEEYLNSENYSLCVELLSSPDMVRGFGPVKEDSVKKARAHQAILLRRIKHRKPKNTGDDVQKAA